MPTWPRRGCTIAGRVGRRRGGWAKNPTIGAENSKPPTSRVRLLSCGLPESEGSLLANGSHKPLHREQFPLDGVMRLIEQGTGRRHLGICEDGIPAYLFVLEPAPDALPVGHPCYGGNVVGKVPESLTQGKHPQALALACPVPQGVKLRAQRLA